VTAPLAAVLALEVPFPVIVLGTIIGMTYGLLAVGLVLIYRSNRIVNFAHGEIGAFAAAVFGVVVIRWHVPYYVALPLAMLLGGAVAALAEVAVVRRLRNAPRLMSIVATLGIGQFLVFFGAAVNTQAAAGFSFPQPPFVPVFQIGALRVTPAYSGMLFIAPLVVLGIAVFLRRSSFGIGIRAAAANAEAARMAGIFAGRMSSLAWALAGGVSAFTAILVQPSRGFTSGESFGPSLLLRALAGAVIARMTSLPQALAAGIGLGVVEQVLLWNYPRAGFVELALFAIILGALLLQRQQGGRDEEKGSWAAVQAWRPVPEALRQASFVVRHLGTITGLVAAAASVLLIFLVTNSDAIIFVSMMGFAVVGLSVGIITGLGGQLSLGQFALAAVGATISYYVSSRTGSFPLAFLYAGLGAAATSLLIGLPALRLRGLMLTVTTLSFALVTPAWLLQQSWMLGAGVDPGRPIVLGRALETGRDYYWVALLVTVLMVLLARNVRRSGFGRLLVAIRDNEDNARAFTVPARLVKVQGFLLAGFIAGVGGAMYGHTFSRIGTSVFSTRASIDVVVMTVIGGISTLAGPLIGVLYTIGIPAFVPLDTAGLAATSLGFLLLIMYLPGGLAQVILPLRDRLVARLVRGRVDPSAAVTDLPEGDATMPVARRLAARTGFTPPSDGRRVLQPKLLEAVDMVKHFGGVRAVDGVSLHVRAGETLGLIGPNGAGKTTTFELLGGFTRPDHGTVRFSGRDITRLGPEARAGLGLIRSFQDAALFPTMTVEETVMLALERVLPTGFLRSCIGLGGTERERRQRAREIVDLMGLARYGTAQIQELSTGTRRITELACLVALEPTLLLLDEPSSGIAQRETEALGTLLTDLKRELSLTLVVIEHDIPLIMGIADRMVVMDAGHVIAAGPPDIVRTDPAVVEAYLGGSIEAIERSGTAGAPLVKEPA
jgi:ABC-type branched-subunit amino acid transport system ATPase component/ABC-type branched-subunit amino acid transport system permease subunit